MNVTLVTAYFFPEVTSVTHLLVDLAADLARCGHRVTVVTNLACRGLDEETVCAYRSRCDEATADNVRVLRVGAKSRETGGLIWRGLRFFVNTLALYRAAAKVETDAYLINSMPPYLGLVGARLAKKRPTVYILQDLFPDSVIAMGKLKKSGLLARLFHGMERHTYRKNTRLITISDDMRDTLLKKGVPADKLDVIGNWIDVDAIRRVARADNALFDSFGLDRGGFYAVYAGALGILQDLDTVLDAAKLVVKEADEVRFVLIGSGGRERELRERIAREGIDSVSMFPLQPVSRAAEVYSLGDVSLVPLAKGATGIALPSKTWTAMAAGSFVIAAADKNSAFEQLIAQAGGAAVPPGDAGALADAVLAAYRGRASLAGRGAKGRAFAAEHLSRKAATKRYEQALFAAARRRKG